MDGWIEKEEERRIFCLFLKNDLSGSSSDRTQQGSQKLAAHYITGVRGGRRVYVRILRLCEGFVRNAAASAKSTEFNPSWHSSYKWLQYASPA
jgi:hypothetical protein